MSATVHPWDPREGEPPEAYARFLSYRNLGPGRSVALAEAVHSGGKRRKKASGYWTDDSARYEWVSRAAAWDVHTLSEQGAELARLWVGILVAAARKAAEKLADPACVPRDFAQAVAVVDRLSPYLTPDVLKALQPAGDDPPGGIEERVRRQAELGARGSPVVPEAGRTEPGVPE